MRIRIVDIPPEGRDLEFDLDVASLNRRVGIGDSHSKDGIKLDSADYRFQAPVHVKLNLQLEGSTVVIHGRAAADFEATCSRCAETAKSHLDVPIDLLLKPASARARKGEGDEDVSFGFYEGQEVECDPFTEEYLILALPYVVLCKEDCKGLCPRCGADLNRGPCSCPEEKPSETPLGILSQIKNLVH